MEYDAREVSRKEPLEADICIIGAGAAGITIAREFVDTPLRVILLESGGHEIDAETQDLYKGENIGRHYYDLDACRLRYFGGTTNHWAGWCRPLAPVDFEKRAWLPNSGWPIRFDDLEPFYRRAQKILQLGPYGYDASALATHFPHAEAFPFDHERVSTESYQFSPPTRFAEVYGPKLTHSDNVWLYLHANVIGFELDETRRVVKGVRCATFGGKKFEVRARVYVLAAGGIENPRLLLAANIGNDHDLVGRYFMDHPEPSGGKFLTIDWGDRRWIPYVDGHPNRRSKTSPLGCITLPRKIQEREGIINSAIGFSYLQPLPSEGYSAFRSLLGKEDRSSEQFGRDLWNVIADIDGFASDASRRIRAEPPPIHILRVETRAQQAPNADSRITLGEERDALGVLLPRLNWRLTDFDRRSARRTLRLVAEELGRLGVGRMKMEFRNWEPEFYYGNHHIGTTRMNAEARLGVVNADCRVHGTSNIYVAGSSVFPTSGNAPPTFTIVALALRLADHIKSTKLS